MKIIAARYAEPLPPDGYQLDAEVRALVDILVGPGYEREIRTLSVADAAIATWLAEDHEIGAYAEEAAAPAPVPELYALADLCIDESEITGIEQAAGLAAAIKLDTGLYWIFFSEPLGSTNYMVFPFTRPPAACEVDRFEDYIEVRVSDFQGAAMDPERVILQINRIRP